MMEGFRLEDLIRDYSARRAELDRVGTYFLRDITDEEAERFSKTMLLMAAQRQGYPGRDLTVFINSGGGSVGAGFAMMESMYHMKRAYGVRIRTIITGYAYSMGAIVFQAGDYRSMGHFSTMMLHGGTWVLTGEDQRIFKDYEKLAHQYQQVISELFAKRTGKHTPRWWRNFIYSGHDRFLSAQECLQMGLVDEICTFESCYPKESDAHP